MTFDDEEDAMRSAPAGARLSGRLKWIVAGIAVIAVTAAGGFAARQRIAAAAAPPVTTGKMTVNTDPPGAEVEVDGETRGRAPLSLALAAGAHTLVVRANGESRTIPVTITAGADVSQYLELPKAGSGFGQLQVRTEPAGARVSIDGTPVGKTPMTIVEIVPGEHAVTLESDLGSVTQKVMIEAGVQASLVVPMGAAQPGRGLVRLVVGDRTTGIGTARERPPSRHERHRPHHAGGRQARHRACQRAGGLPRDAYRAGGVRPGRRLVHRDSKRHRLAERRALGNRFDRRRKRR